MNWPLLLSQLLSSHQHDPQASRRIELAVEEIRLGLQTLTTLGHVWHLEKGPAESQPSWPQTLWHLSGRNREVWHQSDIDELGPDWYPSLAQAKHAEGLAAQFTGRGGVTRRDLPMVVDQPADALSVSVPRVDANALRAEFRARSSEPSNG